MFFPSWLNQLSLTFAGKAGPYLSGAPFRYYLWPYQQILDRAKRLAMNICGGLLVGLVITEEIKQVSVFVPGRPFQPIILFAGDARAYPSGAQTI